MILELNSENPQPRLIKQIAEVMKSGGLAVYPTDTTYGLGCDINNKAAIERILAIKRMPRNKLLSIICCDLRDVSQYAYVSNNAYKIIKRSLPGLTRSFFRPQSWCPRLC
jgi:tRNA threonylcarbamoyl adenosine modification protein (Sua5/YciO/YrdC/YwlC family)